MDVIAFNDQQVTLNILPNFSTLFSIRWFSIFVNYHLNTDFKCPKPIAKQF